MFLGSQVMAKIIEELVEDAEFEKKEIIDTNQIAALIDKAKEVEAVKKIDKNKINQSN